MAIQLVDGYGLVFAKVHDLGQYAQTLFGGAVSGEDGTEFPVSVVGGVFALPVRVDEVRLYIVKEGLEVVMPLRSLIVRVPVRRGRSLLSLPLPVLPVLRSVGPVGLVPSVL